jgi:hypothetical protein
MLLPAHLEAIPNKEEQRAHILRCRIVLESENNPRISVGEQAQGFSSSSSYSLIWQLHLVGI